MSEKRDDTYADSCAKQEWERILEDAMRRAGDAPAPGSGDAQSDLDSDLWEFQQLLNGEKSRRANLSGVSDDPLERLVDPSLSKAMRPGSSQTQPEARRPRRENPQPTPKAAPAARRKERRPEKQEPSGFRKFRRNRLWLLAYLWLTLVFSELVVRSSTISQQFWDTGLWLGMLFAITPALLAFMLATVFSRRGNRIVVTVYTVFVFVLYVSQLVYFKIFSQFYTVTSMGNAKQGLSFLDTLLPNIAKSIVPIILLLLPLLFLLILGKRFFSFKGGATWKSSLLLVALAMVIHFCVVWTLPLWGSDRMSAYDMYYHSYDTKSASAKLSLGTAFRLDIKWHFFGGGDAGGLVLPTNTKPTEPEGGETTPTGESQPGGTTGPTAPAVPETAYNVLDIDFDALIAGEGNADIRQMHQYFDSLTPSRKNDKTGMFKGCNLILITAESFSHLAIDPEVTPTLYKLQTEGFNFTDFYTPEWGVSTTDGEYVAVTGTIPKPGVWSFYRTGEQKNYMPLTMVHQLKELGYCAYAYHDHDYDFYDRDLSHPNLGYIYKGMGNGLEESVTKQWPESDLEMIDFTTADYINQQPFHAYYMTVSGHQYYNFTGNSMSAKNKTAVADLPYSEPVRAYLAANIELDKAMELLLQRLEEAGVAENTVIVISADHHPYGLTNEEISELEGHTVEENFELFHNACIIYKKGMTPETIDEPCCSLDILPTLCNLFGLDFDSRLYMGRDVFSDAEPLVLFQNRSWITDKASYNASTGAFTTFTDETLPKDYESTIDDIVYNKYAVSEKILDMDYWRILFKPKES